MTTTTVNMFNVPNEPERIIWIDNTMYSVPDANAKVEIDWDKKTVSICRTIKRTVDLNVKFTVKL